MLHFVCESHDGSEPAAAAKKLLEKGADPLASDDCGRTAVQVALELDAKIRGCTQLRRKRGQSSQKLCQLLLRGIDDGKLVRFLALEMPGAGCSPLELACRHGMWWAVQDFARVVTAAHMHEVLSRVCSSSSLTLVQLLKHTFNAPAPTPSGQGSEDIRCTVTTEIIRQVQTFLSAPDFAAFLNTPDQGGQSPLDLVFEHPSWPSGVVSILLSHRDRLTVDPVTDLSERLRQLYSVYEPLLSLGGRTYSFLEDESQSTITLSLSPDRLETRGSFRGEYVTERGPGLVEGEFEYDEAADELVLSGTWKEGTRRPQRMELRAGLGCLCDCEACSVEETARGSFVYRREEHAWTWTRHRDAEFSGCPCFATDLRHTLVAPPSKSALSRSSRLKQSIEALPTAAVQTLVQIDPGPGDAGAGCHAVQACFSFQWWRPLLVLLQAGAPPPHPATGTFLSSVYTAALEARSALSLSVLTQILAVPAIVEQATVRACDGRTCLEDVLRKQAQRWRLERHEDDRDRCRGADREKLLELIDVLVDAHMLHLPSPTECWTVPELLALCAAADQGQCRRHITRVLEGLGPRAFLAATMQKGKVTCPLWVLLGKAEWELATAIIEKCLERHRASDAVEHGAQLPAGSAAVRSAMVVHLHDSSTLDRVMEQASTPPRILQLLLAFRPRLSVERLRSSPLHKAIHARSWPLARQLISTAAAPPSPLVQPASSSPALPASADDLHRLVNFPDADSRSPLLLATRALARAQGSDQDPERGELLALVQELVQAGARDASSRRGESALLAAVTAKEWAVMRVLLADRQCIAASLGVVAENEEEGEEEEEEEADSAASLDDEENRWVGKTALQILYEHRVSRRYEASQLHLENEYQSVWRESPGVQVSSKDNEDKEERELMLRMLQVGARPSEIVDTAILEQDWTVVEMVVTEGNVSEKDHTASASLAGALHDCFTGQTEHTAALAALLAAGWATTGKQAHAEDGAEGGKQAAFVADASPSPERYSPLSLAVQKGWVRTTEALLGYESVREAINAQDVFGFTALHHACLRIHHAGADAAAAAASRRTVAMLLRCGADQRIAGKAGQTPLHISAGIELVAPVAGEARDGSTFNGERAVSRGLPHCSSLLPPPLLPRKRKLEGGEGQGREAMPRTASSAGHAGARAGGAEQTLVGMGRSARRGDAEGVCSGILQARSMAEGGAEVGGLRLLLELLPAGGYEWKDTQAVLLRVMQPHSNLNAARPIPMLLQILSAPAGGSTAAALAFTALTRLAHLEQGTDTILRLGLSCVLAGLGGYGDTVEVQAEGLALLAALVATAGPSTFCNCKWLQAEHGVLPHVLAAMHSMPEHNSVTAPAIAVLGAVAEELPPQEVTSSVAAVIAVMQSNDELSVQRFCCKSLQKLAAEAPPESLALAREAMEKATALFPLDEGVRASVEEFVNRVVAADGASDGLGEGEKAVNDDGEEVKAGGDQVVQEGGGEEVGGPEENSEDSVEEVEEEDNSEDGEDSEEGAEESDEEEIEGLHDGYFTHRYFDVEAEEAEEAEEEEEEEDAEEEEEEEDDESEEAKEDDSEGDEEGAEEVDNDQCANDAREQGHAHDQEEQERARELDGLPATHERVEEEGAEATRKRVRRDETEDHGCDGEEDQAEEAREEEESMVGYEKGDGVDERRLSGETSVCVGGEGGEEEEEIPKKRQRLLLEESEEE